MICITKKVIPLQKCTMCGIEKKMTTANFYKSYNPMFQGNYESRMCVCKSCLLEYCKKLNNIYGSQKKALYMCCEMVGSYYSRSLLDQLSDKDNNDIFATYFQKINSLPQYKGKTFRDSDVYDLEQELKEISEDTDRDLILFWGDGYTEDDYRFLENEYKSLITRFECDSYSQEMLFQEIAHQRLDIKKKRQASSSVDKELKTLQDLLGSANIKPVQENASMASEQVTFGTLIKKYENEKPIPEPLGEWEDANWIKKYVLVWFLGHFSKMMGVTNQYSEMYDDEVGQYTVSVEEEQ